MPDALLLWETRAVIKALNFLYTVYQYIGVVKDINTEVCNIFRNFKLLDVKD